METVRTHAVITAKREEKQVSFLSRLFNRQVDGFERNRFAMMALYIIAQSCIGSIACMYVLQFDTGYFLLGLCAMVTMGSIPKRGEEIME